MPPRRPINPAARQHAGSLRVSRYDQVAGMLLSTLLVFGSITLLMFFVWLSSRLIWEAKAVPVTVLEDVGGGGSGTVLGSEQQFEEPAPTEVQQTAAEQVSVEQSLNSVSTVISAKAPDFDAIYGSPSLGAGEGTGMGDGRGKGPGGPGTSDGIPAYERWEIRMSAASLDEYAKQLDFFKVELGVAGGGSPNVDYITNLSSARPTVRVGDPKSEHRLRFLQRSGELRAADRQLAAKAGVKTDGRVVFQFYSEAMYKNLLTLEAARKGNRRIKDVRRTVFGVRSNRGQYEFYVIDQQYMGG